MSSTHLFVFFVTAHYTICGCEIKIFRSFSYQFSIHGPSLFFFLSLLPQVLFHLVEILTRSTPHQDKYSF